jgi:hypothetical protein
MQKTIKGKTTYHCDICGKEGVVSQVLGRDIDLCQWPCWARDTADITDVCKLIDYIKVAGKACKENKHGD